MPITLGMLATGTKPIVYVGRSNGLKVSRTGDVTVHADTSPGDILICEIMSDDGSSASTITGGWTDIRNSLGSEIRLRSLWKWYDGTNTFTVGGTGQGLPLVCRVFTFRNVNKTSPVSAPLYAAAQAGSAFTIPHPDTDVNGAFCMGILGHNITRDSNAVGANSNPTLTDYMEMDDLTTTLNWDGGFGVFGGWKDTAGAVGNTTGSMNDAYIGVRHSFFLRPE